MCDRPYDDHPHLLDLQQHSDVHVGKVLHSRPNVLSTDVIHHIAESMKSKSITAV